MNDRDPEKRYPKTSFRLPEGTHAFLKRRAETQGLKSASTEAKRVLLLHLRADMQTAFARDAMAKASRAAKAGDLDEAERQGRSVLENLEGLEEDREEARKLIEQQDRLSEIGDQARELLAAIDSAKGEAAKGVAEKLEGIVK
jgi:hypothetical protein